MKRRRTRQEGAIYKREEKRAKGTVVRWCASVTHGYDHTGKRKRRVIYGKSAGEVREKLTALKAVVSKDGGLPTIDPRSLEAHLRDWLRDVAEPRVRQSTLHVYRVMIDHHIVPLLKARLDRVTPKLIHDLYARLERDGRKARTRVLVHVVLRMAMQHAVKLQLIPVNPVLSVDRPKSKRPKMDIWSAAETATFLNHIRDDKDFALYHLALATGLRQGELLALQKDDVNLSEGYLSVRFTLSRYAKKYELTEPKTAASRRRVDLSPLSVSVLKRHFERQMALGLRACSWVFPTSKGGPKSASALTHAFQALCAVAGVKEMRFHDMRHVAASLMLLQGTSAKVVQERLGHSSITITMDTYSHIAPTMQREAADKMDALLAVGDS